MNRTRIGLAIGAAVAALAGVPVASALAAGTTSAPVPVVTGDARRAAVLTASVSGTVTTFAELLCEPRVGDTVCLPVVVFR